jgi:actin-like ATPase involved in cell morphogenesis
MDGRSGFFGIDLGTTYSVIAYIDEAGHPAVVRNRNGDDSTPSVVFFEDEGNVVVGKVAKKAAGLFPDRVVSLIKRELGTKDYSRVFFGTEYTPSSISGIIVRALAEDAETDTGRAVLHVVITVPAYFGLLEKDATMRAGEIAGLEVVGIVPEPVAAAMHYGVTGSADGNIFLVYDLGGATFDVTLIQVTEDTIGVLAVGGDHILGGADWDKKLFDYIVEQTIEQSGDDSIQDDEVALQELRALAESTKQALSKAESRTIVHRQTGTAVKIAVTRRQFEEMTSGLLEETIHITDRTLAEAEQRYPGIRGQISKLLLAGGSSWMPAVAERLKGEYPWEVRLDDPGLAVAKGAVLYAAGQVVRPGRILSPGPVTPDAVREVAERTGLEGVGSIGSAFPQVLEAAALSSALVPFVQALAARTADDVYASLRRLLPSLRSRKKENPQSATAVISVADKYSKLILLLPESLNEDSQEILHRLLEKQVRRPAESEEKWLQISEAPGGSGAWNVELVNEIPADCIIVENFSLDKKLEEPQVSRAEPVQNEYQSQLAGLREERIFLREMVKYLAKDIDPKR